MNTIGGLDVIEHGDPSAARVVVLLHGRDMTASELAPFAGSLNVPYVVVPEAPDPSPVAGKTWWPFERVARVPGGIDLATYPINGRELARAHLDRLCDALAPKSIVLIGFSHGGMMALDCALHEPLDRRRVVALGLLSTSRVALTEWEPLAPRLDGMPIFVSHGRSDAELSFAAGEGVRDFATAAGARVTWVPFDGGHEMPLVVWRGLRRFLATC